MVRTEESQAPETTAAHVRQWEVVFGLAVLVLLAAVRMIAWFHAGGLWRDEVHSLNMATYPDISSTWWNDSFPVLFHLILRGWVALFGSSDAAVRAYGLTCSLAQLPVMWWTGRQFGSRAPWAILVLLGFDPTLIIYGGEVRGYGLGVLTYLLMLGCMWRYLQNRSPGNWWLLLISSLSAVQSSYTNSFLLLAACGAGGLVALRGKNVRTCLALLSVGILSAASMAPYRLFAYPKISEFATMSGNPMNLSAQLSAFGAAWSAAGIARSVAWPLLLALSVWTALRVVLFPLPDDRETRRPDLACFLVVNLVIGTAAFWWYIRFLGVVTQVWYYLPLLALLAMTVESGGCLWAVAAKRQLATMLVMGVVLIGMLPTTLRSLALRLTNVDLVAAELARDAAADDLIVVYPWYVGLTFDHYYRGDALWINFPNVGHEEPRGHRGYIKMKRNYMTRPTPECIRTELDQIARTLRGGHRVWLVGGLPAAPPGQLPPKLPPGPDPTFGWSEGFYQSAWSLHAGYLLRTRAARWRQLPIAGDDPVNPLENEPLLVFEGWLDEPRD